MKKTLAIVLTLVLALGLMSGVASAEWDGTFVACLGSQPETIDPQKNSASDASNYIKHLFEGLMRYEHDGSGVGLGAAESYEVSEDGLTWTFKIRDDAKWSDGQDLLAADFEYSFKRLVDPAEANYYALDMGKFILNGTAIVGGEKDVAELGVTALNEKTLEVKLESAVPYFDAIMAFPSFYPVRQDMVEQYGDAWTTKPETCIGNGAFKLQTYTMDEELVLVPSETYYEADTIVPKTLIFKLITDPSAKITAVRSGEVDWSDDLPAEQVEAATAEGLYHVLDYLGSYYVNFNNAKAPFDDVNVRKAFTLALDTDRLASVAAENTMIAADNYIGPGFVEADGVTDFHDVQVVVDRSDYEANKEAAKAALAEAGYPNGEGFPTVEYMTNVASVHLPTAEMMVSMWKDVLGVNVTISQMEWGAFIPARHAGEHQMARGGWIADYYDPVNLLDIFLSDSGNNDVFYASEEYDALLAAADAATDPNERYDLLHQAEMKAFGEDYAVATVYYYKLQCVYPETVSGVATYATGEKLFHFATVAE